MPPQSPGLVTVGYPVGDEDIGIVVGADIGIVVGPDVKGISVG